MASLSAGVTKSASVPHVEEEYFCNPPHTCLRCLSVSALSRELSESQANSLFQIVQLHQLSKGDVLISEGDVGGPLYIVTRGELEVVRGQDGGEVQLGRLGAGMITGQLAFLDGLRRTATVRAADDGTCVLAIAREGLESLLETDPTLVYRVMRAIVRSAHSTIENMNRTYFDTMRYIRG